MNCQYCGAELIPKTMRCKYCDKDHGCVFVTKEELSAILKKCEYVDVFPNHLHGIDNVGFLYGRRVVMYESYREKKRNY